MSRKGWLFLILILVLLFGYKLLFYKQFPKDAIPTTADIIAVVDVKNVARSYLKEFLIHPSRWFGSRGKQEKELKWRKIFDLPDYICFFHCAGQGGDKWYVRLKIKSRTDFHEAIALFHFQKMKLGESVLYSSSELGMHFYTEGGNVILASYPCTSGDIWKVGRDLFINHQFLPNAVSRSFENTTHHGILLFRNGRYFSAPGTVGIDVDGGEVIVKGKIFPVANVNAQPIPVVENSNDVLNLSLAPVPSPYLKLFPDSLKGKWTRFLGLPVDSLFLNDKYSWAFSIHHFRQRTDTAVRFEFDENFNEVKKSTIIHTTEPVMELIASGEGAEHILSMMKIREMVENENDKMRFTGFPLWPLYVSSSANRFVLGNLETYSLDITKKDVVASLEMHPIWIPDSLFRFIPDKLRPWIQNTASISIKLVPSENSIKVEGKMRRKEGTYF